MSLVSIILIILGVLALALAVAVYLAIRGKASNFKFDIGGQTPRASGGNDTSSETVFKSRFIGLGVFSGTILGALFARLWSMQVISSDDYVKQAESNRTRTVSLIAPRGRILDRNGVELVTNRSSLTLTAKSDVATNDIEVALLANLLGMPRVACRHKIQDATEGAQNARTIAVDVRRSAVAFIQEHIDIFPGITVERRTQRAYPQGTLACHVLGYTGTVTQDQIKASENNSDGLVYESGDTAGQAGVEYQYESILQGIRGEQTVYVDANGSVLTYSTSVPAESGSDIKLTIDATLQKAAEDALAKGISKAVAAGSTNCNSGAAVVIDTTNGEILAMASAPQFRPELFVGGISQDDWEALSSESAGNPLMNRSIAGQYVPASTVKPLTAFAALDYGIATASSDWVCRGWWTGFGEANGKYCWKHSGHGDMSLRSGITYSCDVVFYEVAKGFYNSGTQDGMQDTFRKWGLGAKTGIDLPGEASGRIPDAAWKSSYFSSWSEADRQWNGGDYTNIAIGQGDMLVTPLQMCCTYMGLGTKGAMWEPHVLKSVLGRSGDNAALEYQPKTYLSPEEPDANYDVVHAGLSGVIYEESASVTAHFITMKTQVAGKTGTGEHGDGNPTAWFCAYAPADNPRYAVAAVIDQGGFGSTSALFTVRDILGALFDEPDTSTASVSDGTR